MPGLDLHGLTNRPEGEHRRRQQAKAGGHRQGQRVDADRHLEWKPLSGETRHRPWRRRAQDQAEAGAHNRQRENLGEIDAEDHLARGTQALQGGDGRGSPFQKGAHRVGHPDAANQQRGQADQAEI